MTCLLNRRPFRPCATPNKLARIKKWMGSGYVLHKDYVFQEHHRLDCRTQNEDAADRAKLERVRAAKWA